MTRMRTITTVLTMAIISGFATQVAMADGFIVPVRPSIVRPRPELPRPVPFRGSWAVKYHHVDILVRDQVASVSIDQEFLNTSGGMMEVEYFFPVPPGAAIDKMTLVVNGKEFAAKLLKADEARKIYEDIVRRKKDPALLEYAGYGLYKTSAFPLEKDKPCRVVVNYKQICKKDGNMVEVWYPLNTEKFSSKKIEDVRVTVDIKSKADLTAVYSPSHDLDVKRKDTHHVIATYHEKEVIPATDIQVFYHAANEEIGATLLTHQPQSEQDGYFVMLVSPNPKLGETSVVAKDVVVVFDHSGSMGGTNIRQAREAVGFVLKHLNPLDRFNVIPYNDGVETFFDALADANEKNIKRALDDLDRVDAGGGTNISESLQTACKMLDKKDGRPKYIIFLTDGLPTVGLTDEKKILTAIQEANQAGVRLFAFGVGYGVNVRLLDNLVRDNNGRSDYVKPSEPIEGKIASLYNKIKNPVMTDLTVSIHGVKIKDMYPRKIGDLFDGDQIVITGRYDCRDVAKLPEREKGVYATQLVVKGMYLGKERAFEYPVDIVPGTGRHGFDFVEKLWAIRRVGFLLDQVQLHGETKEVVDDIIRLSKTYGIMTPYTSFLADETTELSRPTAVRGKAAESLGRLAKSSDGLFGQSDAKMRQSMNEATLTPADTRQSAGGKPAGVSMYGNRNEKDYEAGKEETVANVRQVGNQAMFRRGQVWIAANASDVDLAKEADNVQVVQRFSDEYFKLVKANTIEENRILATQQAGEELVIRLRNQVYRIE